MMNCKFLLIFGFLLASLQLILADQFDEECIKEQGNLTPAEIQAIKDGKTTAQKDASKNLKCFLLCIYKKHGIVTADGKQNPEAVMKYMQAKIPDKSKMMPIMASCASMAKSDDSCAQVYAFEECVTSKA